VREKDTEFLGLIRVPLRAVKQLEKYFRILEDKEQISIKSFSLVTNQQINTSMKTYAERIGWKDITEAHWKKIVSKLRVTKPRKRQDKPESSITPFFQSWNCQHHPLSSELTLFYCNSPLSFSYEELPFNAKHDEGSFRYSQTEIGLMKLLLKNRVLNLIFIPDQLHLEYSLDHYWITLSKISMANLSHFTEILPYCRLIYTGTEIHLLVLLKQELVKRIKRDLEWIITPINPYYYPKNPDISWYNFETHEWRTPKDIQEF
jgi:hypothetical protein